MLLAPPGRRLISSESPISGLFGAEKALNSELFGSGKKGSALGFRGRISVEDGDCRKVGHGLSMIGEGRFSMSLTKPRLKSSLLAFMLSSSVYEVRDMSALLR